MRLKTGIIGCGKISAAYLRTLTSIGSPHVDIVACADLNAEAAQARAAEFGIRKVLTTEALLADPEIELVVNLTIPEAHAELNRAALVARKHVYCEKPLALDLPTGKALVALAQEHGLLFSSAPDTLLGVAQQQARCLIDKGHMGSPVGAYAHLEMGHRFRPAMLREATGPLLDMGPYYAAALIHLLGPVKRVAALGSWPQMISPDGTPFQPVAPARVVASLEFSSGAIGNLSLQNFGQGYNPRLEIFGTKGTLVCADPNKFAGPVHIDPEQSDIAFPDWEFSDGHRGAGIIDMARAIGEQRDCRLNAPFCLHTLELLLAILDSLKSGRAVDLQTTCERPAPMLPIAQSSLCSDK